MFDQIRVCVAWSTAIVVLGGCSTSWQLATTSPVQVVEQQRPARIRVTRLDETQVVARVASVASDTLVVQGRTASGATAIHRVPFSDILKLEYQAPDPPFVRLRTDSLWVGSKVRVGFDAGDLVGEVRRVSADSLVLRLQTGTLQAVSWPAASSLEVAIREGTKARRGAVLGLGLGTAFALTLATSGDGDQQIGGPLAFAMGFVIVALPATGIGALIGSQVDGHEWRAIPIPPPHR